MSIKRYDPDIKLKETGMIPFMRVLEDGHFVLYRDHCELLAQLMEKSMDGGWISVEDRLPDHDVYVLWLKESGIVYVADIGHDDDWPNFKETHERPLSLAGETEFDPLVAWMPIPEYTPREPLDRSSL